eukprot:FR736467.1.p1 GENE.FR736467.1~~FR736467.1.p1  ORF type:complete len:123 (+),score=8.70 FR736467.1:375-743(+)
MNTLNQKWTYTPEGTLELSQLKGDRMSVLDVWTDLKGGVVHNGVMLYSKHGNPNQRWIVTTQGHIISLAQSSDGHVLLLTMGDDGIVTEAPPIYEGASDAHQWALLPVSLIPRSNGGGLRMR